MFCVAICGIIPRSFPLARIDTTGGLMGSLFIDFSIVSTFFIYLFFCPFLKVYYQGSNDNTRVLFYSLR